MRILVTGGGGFLGSYIIEELLKLKYEVSNLSRNAYPKLISKGVKCIQGDISDPEFIKNLDLSNYDSIFHVAAKAGVWGSKDSFYSINYHGAKQLFDKAISDKVQSFIYTSTPSVVFGADDILEGDESMAMPKEYLTHYARSKSMAESYILNNCNQDTKAMAIRPHLIWGPEDPHLLPRLIQKAKSGRLKRVGDGSNLVDIIYVENAAKAHIDALHSLVMNEEISGNAYFIGQERPVNLWDFIDTLLVKSKQEPVLENISFKKAYFLGGVLEKVFGFFGINSPEPPMTRFVATQLAKSHYFSHKKAQNDFGYKVGISIEEGLERTFATQKTS
jgi:nucleoside-diphosphate-sugar epimerase